MLQWVSRRSSRSGVRGRIARPCSASRPWSRVASAQIASASTRSVPATTIAVVGKVAQALEPGHHPVDRPADVDRRRAALAEGRGGAPDQRPAVRHRGVPGVLGGQGQAVGRGLAEGRRAADDHRPDRLGDLAAVGAGDLQQLARQAALVDEVDRAGVNPEGGPEPTRFARYRIRPGHRAEGRHGHRRGHRVRIRAPAGLAAGGSPRPSIDSGLRSVPAASVAARWRAPAEPATVAAVWITSAANWRKKRRRARSTSTSGPGRGPVPGRPRRGRTWGSPAQRSIRSGSSRRSRPVTQ